MKRLSILFVLLLALIPTLALATNTGTMSGAAGGGSRDCPLENIVSSGSITSTAGANTSAIAAQGAGFRVWITQVVIDSKGTTVASDLIVTDGSGGTTLIPLAYPAGTGATYVFPLPLVGTMNTAIFVDPTGTEDIKVTIIGCKRTL